MRYVTNEETGSSPLLDSESRIHTLLWCFNASLILLKTSTIADFLREAALSVMCSTQDMHWISKGAILIDPLHIKPALAALFQCREVGSRWLKTPVSSSIRAWLQVLSRSKPWEFSFFSSCWELIPSEASGGASYLWWMKNEGMNEKPKSCYINLVVYKYPPSSGVREKWSELWFMVWLVLGGQKSTSWCFSMSSPSLGPWPCISCSGDPAFSNC